MNQPRAVSLRNASAEDTGLIRELSLRVWPQTYDAILSREQIRYMLNLMYSEAALHRQMRDGQRFYLICSADTPVGFASYSAPEPQLFKLHKFYLLPQQQGRGSGRAAMQQLINQIKNEGAAFLQLNVNRNNPALEFYKKLGFTTVREEDIDIGGGFFMNDYVMEKKLV